MARTPGRLVAVVVLWLAGAVGLGGAALEEGTCDPKGLIAPLSDPDPKTNTLLARYNIPQEPFRYRLRLVAVSQTYRVHHLTFPSPRKWDIAESNTVHAEYYVPRSRRGRGPAVVVLHILDGRFAVARLICRSFAMGGVASLMVEMPYYGERRPGKLGLADVFFERPERMVWAIEGAVGDVRRAAAWLRRRPEVDPGRVGLVGVSLGGIVGALVVGVDPSFDRNVLILSGGDPAGILWTAPETRGIRAELVEKGYDLAALRRFAQAIDPVAFAHRADPRRILMINAANDRTVLREETLALWKAFGKPKIEWYPAGHYSLALYIPGILPRALAFVSALPAKEK